jgi:hypothetical protein
LNDQEAIPRIDGSFGFLLRLNDAWNCPGLCVLSGHDERRQGFLEGNFRPALAIDCFHPKLKHRSRPGVALHLRQCSVL